MPSLLAQLAQLDIETVEVVSDLPTGEPDLKTLVTGNERTGLEVITLLPEAFAGCDCCGGSDCFCCDCCGGCC